MPSLGQAVAALWLVLGTARAANYVVYDGGVRRQNDTTITNNTYAPGLGGRFAGGASGLVLTDVGAGWRVEAVGGVAAATPAVHRSVCAYGNGGDFANCSTRWVPGLSRCMFGKSCPRVLHVLSSPCTVVSRALWRCACGMAPVFTTDLGMPSTRLGGMRRS